MHSSRMRTARSPTVQGCLHRDIPVLDRGQKHPGQRSPGKNMGPETRSNIMDRNPSCDIMTQAGKNITLSQTSLAGGNNCQGLFTPDESGSEKEKIQRIPGVCAGGRRQFLVVDLSVPSPLLPIFSKLM